MFNFQYSRLVEQRARNNELGAGKEGNAQSTMLKVWCVNKGTEIKEHGIKSKEH